MSMVVSFHGPLIRQLVEDGVEVHVAANPAAEGNGSSSEIRGLGAVLHAVRIARTGLNPFADASTLFGLLQLTVRIRPDVVLAYTAKPVVYGLLSARAAGVRRRYALITGLGYAFTGQLSGTRWLVNKILTGLYRLALASAPAVFFQNPDDLKEFRDRKMLRAKTVGVVVDGCGVDLDKFKQAPLPDGPFTFLMIARLIGDKGVREYLAAADKVAAADPQTRFLLVGGSDTNPGALSDEELSYWRQRGTVTLIGSVKDVRPFIARSHVVVLPSYREGLPQSSIEALAMGRPLITTDVPGCRETVVEGENGFLVPARDVEALSQAMLQAAIMGPDLSRLAVSSRKLAETRFDVRKVNAQLVSRLLSSPTAAKE